VVVVVTAVASMTVRANLELFVEFPSGRWGSVRRSVLRGSLNVVVVMVVVVTVTTMTTMTMRTNLEIIDEFAGRGSGSVVVWNWLRRRLLGHVMTVVAVVAVVAMVVAAVTDVAFTTFTNGLSDDGCDGSSSENECNGEFDLNHF